MDFAGKARKLERRIARTVDAAVDEFMGTDAPAPLEIVHAVLDRTEQQIQEAGRGRRVFPFNRVIVHVVADARDREARARYAAATEGPPTLSERVAARLASAGCRVTGLTTEIVYAAKPGADWQTAAFHIEFDKVHAAPTPPVAGPVRIRLTVAKGEAEQRAYAFGGGRIDIGRGADVLDQKQRLIRTNQVAFREDDSEANGSVSRRHAHIVYGADAAEYRLCDDHSTHGTSIVREGRTIKVPAATRGTRLQSGDEIALGHARLRVALERKPS